MPEVLHWAVCDFWNLPDKVSKPVCLPGSISRPAVWNGMDVHMWTYLPFNFTVWLSTFSNQRAEGLLSFIQLQCLLTATFHPTRAKPIERKQGISSSSKKLNQRSCKLGMTSYYTQSTSVTTSKHLMSLEDLLHRVHGTLRAINEQRSCEVSCTGAIQNLPGSVPAWTAVGGPALAGKMN